MAVRFIKWESKNDAGNEYKQQVGSHFDHTGLAPEKLPGVADSAYFSINPEEANLCGECGLVAALGPYTIYISFKGQILEITRTRAKEVALQILKMMYDRIPGLAPSRIRNSQIPGDIQQFEAFIERSQWCPFSGDLANSGQNHCFRG